MQQVIQFLISLEEKRRIDEEARKLGLKSPEFIRLLIKLYLKGLKLEHRELASELIEQNSQS